MFIPYPNFSIPDLGSKRFRIPDPRSGSASKNVSIFNPKIGSKLSEYDPWCPGSGSWYFTHPGSRIRGSKRHWILDPGFGSAALALTLGASQLYHLLFFTTFAEAQVGPARYGTYSMYLCTLRCVLWLVRIGNGHTGQAHRENRLVQGKRQASLSLPPHLISVRYACKIVVIW